MKSKFLNLRVDLQSLPDEAVMPRKEKGFGEEKEMKKKMLPIIIGIVLVFGATSVAKFLIGVAA